MKRNDCKDINYCMVSSGKMYATIPKNLINGLDNSEIYYAKIADELIRYKKLKEFIINNVIFKSFEYIYNIQDYEILIIQSLLVPEYFENLVIVPENKRL